MYDKISSSARNTAVIARSLAIIGRLSDSIALIDEALLVGKSLPAIDQVGLWMVKAEVLHWDCKDAEALEVFNTNISPLLPTLSDEETVIVGRNRSNVCFSLFQPDDFYGLVDYSRQAGVELWRNETIFHATNAAAVGQHYESLPTIWRELHRCYLQGCWSPYHLVSRYMAKQCLQLGLGHEAAFHAIISLDKEMAKQVGEYLLRFASSELLAKAVGKLIECGQLQRHFVTACQVIGPMVDAIPDEMCERVFVWLLERAKSVPGTSGECGTMYAAWETLHKLAFRLDDNQATRLADTAAGHPSWLNLPEKPNQVIPVRKTMLQAICHSTSRVKARTASKIADAVIPLATDRKQSLDYADAIETLCQLASRGGTRLKSRLGNILYPKGQRLNTVLLQVSHVFDQPLNKPDALAQDADRIAQNVQLQVQRLPASKQPQPVNGTILMITSERESEKLIVHMTQPLDVFAIFRHRQTLPTKALSRLIDAVLDMIREPENVLANKIGLAQSLACVGDVCGNAAARRIFDTLSPLARGDITEPTCVMSAAEVANPLNPWKIGSGKPNELRGVSLYTLACIARDNHKLPVGLVNEAIAAALGDADSTVRALALASAREMPSLPASVITGILLATRDHESDVVVAAYGAISKILTDRQSEDTWRLIAQSLQFAICSGDVRVRRAAAHAVSRIVDHAPRNQTHDDLKALQAEFGKDRCYSVRSFSELPH